MPLDLSAIDNAPLPTEQRAPIVLISEHAKRKGLHPLLLAAPVLAQLADAYTTSQNLKNGAREANPVLEPFAGNDAALYGAKIGAGVLGSILADRLARSGHRTAAKILDAVEIGVPAGAAIHNALVGKGR
jgi:hypothetical protein